MSFTDMSLMAVIVAAAIYILYRSFWKKKGHCSGCCGSSSCASKK